MADVSGQADIRGIDIDRVVKGFADEEFTFKRFVKVVPTKAREFRWFQKTAGVLAGPTTSGITANFVANAGSLGKPTQLEPSFTKNTSYVKEFIADSPWISDADYDDNDVDLFSTVGRDVTRAVLSQVNSRIWNVITESQSATNINAVTAAGTGWADTTNGNPIRDMMSGSYLIASNNYNAEDCVAIMNPLQYTQLVDYVIRKGSQFAQFTSDQLNKRVLTRIMEFEIVRSNSATNGYCLVMVRGAAATYKPFTEITAEVIRDPLIGRRFRVKEVGECILHDPKACTLIDTVP
jgi:hypothetical protein